MKRIALILALLAQPLYAGTIPILRTGPLLLPKAMLHSPLYDIIGTAKLVVAGGTNSGTGTIANQGDIVLGISSQGIIVRTGVNTYTVRSLAADTGITISNTDGVSGNPTIGVDTTVVPLFSTGTAVPSANCAAGSQIYAKTDTNDFYSCTSTNTWTKINGGGGGWTMSAAKVFADTPVTVASVNTMYPCNAVGGATVFNLPACSGKGNLLILLKKTDSSANKCEFSPNGADTIDGANAVFDIITQWSTVMVQCDGTSAWYIE